MAKKYKDQTMSFAIASKGEYARKIDDWKMDVKEEVLVGAKNEKGEIFLMKDDQFR